MIRKLLSRLWRPPSPETLRLRQVRAAWRDTARPVPVLLLLRLVNRSRSLAAIAAAARSEKTASRLARRKRWRLIARRTNCASKRLAVLAGVRLCQRRFHRQVRWPLRRLLTPVRRWLAVQALCLCLRLLLALLWCCGIRACSKSPRAW